MGACASVKPRVEAIKTAPLQHLTRACADLSSVKKGGVHEGAKNVSVKSSELSNDTQTFLRYVYEKIEERR